MNIKPQMNFESIVETLIRLSVLLLLLWWCIVIISPFLLILAWGGIIAIALHPAYLRLIKIFNGKVIASLVLTILMLSIIVIPSWLLINSMFDGIHYLRGSYESGQSIISPPGEVTKNWPAFTQSFVQLWRDASVNIEKVMSEHSEQIKKIAVWIFGAFSNFGQGLLQFVASIIIAGILFVYSGHIHASSISIFKKLAGKHGDDFAEISRLQRVRSINRVRFL